MRKEFGSSKMPLSFVLPSTTPSAPHSAMPYQHPCCSIQSHLSCIKCKFQRIALTYAVEKKECGTVMRWLLSNPQLNKHRGHLQVGRHWDVCLSRQSTSLPLLQLTPLPLKRKGEETARAYNCLCDLHSQSCCSWSDTWKTWVSSFLCVSAVRNEGCEGSDGEKKK